jgi:hypothetical protein
MAEKKVGVKDASKVEVTGKTTGKGKAALKADLNKLVAFTRSNKFKTMTGKKRVWSQIDNYRVALGTLKQGKRKSVSQNNPTGTTTYGKGKTKVAKEKGFSVDSGRGGTAKSAQRPGSSGKKGKDIIIEKPKPGTLAPNRKSPASTMATTRSKYSGGIASDDTRSGAENYRYRRYNQPAMPSKKPGKTSKPRGGTR